MSSYVSQFVRDHALVESVSALSIEAALASIEANTNLSDIAQKSHRLESDDDFWGDDEGYYSYFRPYKVVDGILYIPVKGVLLADFPFQYGPYATGFQYIVRAVRRGMADDNVRGIVFLINSGGGTVAECFDCAQDIFDQRGKKPMTSIACDFAYSAAYMVASAADRVVVARTGGVGSIGVVTMHADMSKMLDDIGLKVTFIFAGDHKVDGNPYEALPDDVKSRIQARIDATYGIFTADVARNRGLDVAKVVATQALTFGSADAIANGLADAVSNVEDEIAALIATIENPPSSDGEDNEDEDEDGAKTMADTKANTDAATATAERTRISTILSCEGAKRNPEQANHLAFKTSMSAEEAVEALSFNKGPSAETKDGKGEGEGKGDGKGEKGKKAEKDGEDDDEGEGEGEDDGATTSAGLPRPGSRARAEGYARMNDKTGTPAIKQGTGDDNGQSGEGGGQRDPYASLAKMRGWQQ